MTPNDVSQALERGEEAFESYDYVVALGHFKDALSLLDRHPPSFQRDKQRNTTTLRIVDALERSGKWLDALMYVETLINIANVKKDFHLEVEANLKGGNILLKRGSWKEALKRFKRLHERVEKSGTPGERGECLLGVATAEWRLGNNREAKVLAEKSINLLRTAENQRLEGKAIILLASILHDVGDFAASISFFKESIDILRSIGDTIDLARAYNNLGEVYKAQEEYSLASEQYDLCVKIAKASNNNRSEAYGLTNASECMARLGRVKDAEERLVRIEELLEKMEDEYVLANVEFVKGLIAHKKEEKEDMQESFSSAIMRIEKLETPYDLGVFSLEYARCLRSMGETDMARNALEKSRNAFERAHADKYLEKVEAEKRLLPEA